MWENAWGMYFGYTMQECVEEKCYQDETAWGEGIRYVEQGNWATYSTYEPGKTPLLFAFALSFVIAVCCLLAFYCGLPMLFLPILFPTKSCLPL